MWKYYFSSYRKSIFSIVQKNLFSSYGNFIFHHVEELFFIVQRNYFSSSRKFFLSCKKTFSSCRKNFTCDFAYITTKMLPTCKILILCFKHPMIGVQSLKTFFSFMHEPLHTCRMDSMIQYYHDVSVRIYMKSPFSKSRNSRN